MTTDAKTAVLEWTDALNRGDAEAAASYFTEDGVWNSVGFGMVCEGRAAMVAVWSSGVFTELQIVKTTVLVQGDAFASEWTMSGRHSGPVPGVPATGRTFRVTGAGVGEMRDGKIARIAEYWNMADFLSQVGML